MSDLRNHAARLLLWRTDAAPRPPREPRRRPAPPPVPAAVPPQGDPVLRQLRDHWLALLQGKTLRAADLLEWLEVSLLECDPDESLLVERPADHLDVDEESAATLARTWRACRLIDRWQATFRPWSDQERRHLLLAAALQDFSLLAGRGKTGGRFAYRGPALDRWDVRHASRSAAWLQVGLDRPELVPLLISQHHERCNGSGGPAGLTRRQLSGTSQSLLTLNRAIDLWIRESEHDVRHVRSESQLLLTTGVTLFRDGQREALPMPQVRQLLELWRPGLFDDAQHHADRRGPTRIDASHQKVRAPHIEPRRSAGDDKPRERQVTPGHDAVRGPCFRRARWTRRNLRVGGSGATDRPPGQGG